MPGGSRKGADEALVAALAGGATAKAAAQLCGVSEATVYRRLQDGAFRRRLGRARAEAVERAVGRLSEAALHAALVLHKLLSSKDEKTQLRAAIGTLQLVDRLRAGVDQDQRMLEIELRLDEADGAERARAA